MLNRYSQLHCHTPHACPPPAAFTVQSLHILTPHRWVHPACSSLLLTFPPTCHSYYTCIPHHTVCCCFGLHFLPQAGGLLLKKVCVSLCAKTSSQSLEIGLYCKLYNRYVYWRFLFCSRLRGWCCAVASTLLWIATCAWRLSTWNNQVHTCI